jgi:hypothetical protein
MDLTPNRLSKSDTKAFLKKCKKNIPTGSYQVLKVLIKIQKEREIKKAILRWLNLQPDTFAFPVSTTGIPDAKSRTGWRKNPFTGISDIIGVTSGKFFAAEVKTEKNKPTQNQISFLQKVDRAEGYAVVVHSVAEMEEAFAEIKGIK